MLYDTKRIAALMAQARERSGIAQETLAALLQKVIAAGEADPE